VCVCVSMRELERECVCVFVWVGDRVRERESAFRENNRHGPNGCQKRLSACLKRKKEKNPPLVGSTSNLLLPFSSFEKDCISCGSATSED
jgi:hypothetical protein